jgi:hypothetical protein
MVRIPTATLVGDAAAIVRGTVTGVRVVPAPPGASLETRVTIEVTDTIAGDAPGTIEVRVPGGVLGRTFHYVTDLPDFAVGEDAVVFLAPGLTSVAGRIQGKATIEGGIVRENGLAAADYLLGLRRLVAGEAPGVDLDGPFAPVSSIAGWIEREKYGYDGNRWAGHEVGLTINENCADTGGEGDAIRTAMATWTYAPADFTFTYDGTNTRTSYSQNYRNEAFWTNADPGGAIAVTYIWGYGGDIAECDLAFFNPGYTWSAGGDPQPSEMDVQNIATHELGHFLMLLDLYDWSDSQKTMFGYADSGETYKRSLDADDIDGIVHIYGQSSDDDDTSDDDDDDTGTPRDCTGVCNKLVTCHDFPDYEECIAGCDRIDDGIYDCVDAAKSCAAVDACLGFDDGPMCEDICDKLLNCGVVDQEAADGCKLLCIRGMIGADTDCLDAASNCSEINACYGGGDDDNDDADDDQGGGGGGGGNGCGL